MQSPQWLRNIKTKNYPWYRFDTMFSKKKYKDPGWLLLTTDEKAVTKSKGKSKKKVEAKSEEEAKKRDETILKIFIIHSYHRSSFSFF